MIVIVTIRAEKNLARIAKHISEEGYPDTACQFLIRFESFI